MIEFFLTEQDPNYRIKGSRDPLGFQKVWTRTARLLIRHISSVSLNIKDFQTLLYGHYFFRKIGDGKKTFLTFFLKFEQASAYARQLCPEMKDSFNGKEVVSRKIGENPDGPYYCSLTNEDQILSNQKTYGIWGKYSRPFRDMKLNEIDHIDDLLTDSITEKSDLEQLTGLCRRICNPKRYPVTVEELELLAVLYRKLSTHEVDFFRRNLLQIPGENHLQNEFYFFLRQHADLLDGSFHLFNFINAALKKDLSDDLRGCLQRIADTERVLFRLNSIFRGLQTRSVWNFADKDGPWGDLSLYHDKISASFVDSELETLNSYLDKTLTETVGSIAERNNKICEGRHQKGWVDWDQQRLRVHYREGGGWAKKNSFDNSYFIAAYLNLFSQVEGLT